MPFDTPRIYAQGESLTAARNGYTYVVAYWDPVAHHYALDSRYGRIYVAPSDMASL